MLAHSRQFIFILQLGVSLLFVLPLTAASRNFCAVCHSEVAVKYRESIHAREDLNCTTCHGGDAAAQIENKAHSGDFRETPGRDEIPQFCASCHSDPNQMRAYGLPVDQYALYMTSGHGRKFAAGDTAVAVCTDCHGTHRILSKTAADSPINYLNISTTCDACHSAAGQMMSSGLAIDVVADYEASVHAEALRQQGDLRAPTCISCHGSHGALPPGVGNIDKVCGQCHQQTREAFRQSPHWKTMAEEGWGDCVACHDNHRVQAPTSQMWLSACVDCHQGESPEARTGAKVLALLTEAEAAIDLAHEVVGRVREIPLDVADYEARLITAATYLVEVRPLSHTLDLDAIEEMTRKARSVAQEVEGESYKQIQIVEDRHLILVLIWIYILVTIIAIQYYKRYAR